MLAQPDDVAFDRVELAANSKNTNWKICSCNEIDFCLGMLLKKHLGNVVLYNMKVPPLLHDNCKE